MRRAVKIIFAVILVAAVISTVRYCANPYASETVTYYEYEKSISGDGFILRNETIVTNETSGVFEPSVNDGERVPRQSKIGSVISGRPDEKTVSELNSLKQRIEDIEKSNIIARLYQTDTMRIANAVKNAVEDIRTAVESGDYLKASELKKDIGYLKDRTDEIENGGAREELLAELYDRKAEIENALGDSQSDVFAPIAGVYTSALDGLEKYGSDEEMALLTPADVENFDKILKDYEKAPADICKLTDNYNWYLVAVISEEEAENAKVGGNVSVTLYTSDSSQTDGEIYSLSEAQDGKRVMIVKCNKFVNGITSIRSVSYKVALQRKTGLKIPTEALRIVDGKKGVYILLDKKKSFRYVNNDPFRTEDDKFYIVERNYIPQGADIGYVPLKEYDEVLLSPEDVK